MFRCCFALSVFPYTVGGGGAGQACGTLSNASFITTLWDHPFLCVACVASYLEMQFNLNPPPIKSAYWLTCSS